MKKLLVLLIVLFVCGCSNKPTDVPTLFPCKITVTKDETPIDGVHVILGATKEGIMYVSSGVTNSSGTAIISTSRNSWRGDGVPLGEYIITLSKEPKYEGGMSKEEYQKLDPTEQEKYNLKQQREYDKLPREIPGALSEFDKSPHRITIIEGKENVLTIDIPNNSRK